MEFRCRVCRQRSRRRFRAVEIALRGPQRECQEYFEAVKDVPQERISGRTGTLSQDRPLQRTVEPTQNVEENFEVHKIVLPERIQEKNCAQIGVPVNKCNSALPSKLGSTSTSGRDGRRVFAGPA